MPAVSGPIHTHAPNAALLIDFDNVTMGIRSDLQQELRHLLGSEIIKGKVAVQRAYADWRRYPQYIVPLAESSIDMIMAPAYGSSKKNATDIRLAVDAMELVFTRPEIGTYILLSGDSDFASLVTKLKEYGKYVIGVGIRESSSDLLVMNCDEYYSYNALAGLVKAGDEEVVKYDPWELVSEAIKRMSQNGDVMRSDRLKQVMQEIDNSFDEKNLGISKFSRFCLEAAQRGLISVNKLENGQLEVGLPKETAGAPSSDAAASRPDASTDENGAREARDESVRREERSREERGRRGRRGRGGRGRDREDRGPRLDVPASAPAATDVGEDESVTPPHGDKLVHPPTSASPVTAAAPESGQPADTVGISGERLTRQEAFSLVGRAVAALTSGDRSVPASRVRQRAFELLGRDSESLSERNFIRILKDAHDGDVIDLRRRGDDYEVAQAVQAAPVADQLNRAAAAATAAAPKAPTAPPLPRGMGPRGAGSRGRGPAARGSTPPPDLLLLGVVDEIVPPTPPAPTITASLADVPAEPSDAEPVVSIVQGGAPKRGRGRKKAAAKKGAAKPAREPARAAAPTAEATAPAPARPKPRRPRAKKTPAPAAVEG
jgi:uncharacterized protein (TIGR00288 family)